jgi:hypothetical protein
MRSSLLSIVVIVLGVVLLATVVPGIGDDYLVIKRKDGSTQKVPLKFNPDQIESFQVESAGPAGKAAKPGGEESEGPGEAAERPPQQTSPTGQPSIPPTIRREPRPSGPFGLKPEAQPRVGPGISERGPAQSQAKPKEEAPPAQPVPRGPVAAMAPGGKGVFTVNLYKLPENISALPDYSAFRPTGSVTSNKIDLDPDQGEKEPAGIPSKAEALGMRFMGMFLVAGEGIFKWRLQSKDGARMHIDDKTLIENDGVHGPTSKNGYAHLSEGVHSIIVDSFNAKGNPVLKLFVQPPLGPEQVFDISQGLAGWKEPAKPYDVLWGQVYFVPKGNYPNGPDLSRLSPIGRLIAPELNMTGSDGIPGLPGKKEMVGISYQGFFQVRGAGIFAFRLIADDFAKLVIGKQVVAETERGSKADAKGKLGWAFLQEGSYPISVEYFNAAGAPKLQLFVTPPKGEETLFAPAKPLQGFSSEEGNLSQIPAFVYFLKPGTKRLPNFNKLSPSGMFFTNAIDYPLDRGSKEFPGVPQREDWLGLRFYVKFTLTNEEAGAYKFRIVCNDGARLILGKNLVVDASGPGKHIDKSGTVEMKAGSHEMFLDYFQTAGPNGIQLFITPPGGQEKVFAFN